MKKKMAEIIFILDRSGSMSGLEKDTIGGFNSLIKKEKRNDPDTLVTTVLFNNGYEVIHERKNINEINPLTEKEYCPSGTTALLDAVGKTLKKIFLVYSDKKEIKSSKILLVITTDGYENASTEYTYEKINQMITKGREKYKIEFLFLGANIDVKEEAEKLGISKEKAVSFCADEEGMKASYELIAKEIKMFRKINLNEKRRKICQF